MTSRDFCFWLQGFFEIEQARRATIPAGTEMLTIEQYQTIQRHLAMVFQHEIDPSMGGTKHQNELNKIHGGKDTVLRC